MGYTEVAMLRTDWTVPSIDHPDVDMYRRRRRAVLHDEHPLPYAGLPRDWIEQAIAMVVMFDPDQVFLFGSTLRGEDGVGSDIDLLVPFDGIPLGVWDQWERRIRYTARFFCSYRVNAFVTDVEEGELDKLQVRLVKDPPEARVVNPFSVTGLHQPASAGSQCVLSAGPTMIAK